MRRRSSDTLVRNVDLLEGSLLKRVKGRPREILRETIKSDLRWFYEDIGFNRVQWC